MRTAEMTTTDAPPPSADGLLSSTARRVEGLPAWGRNALVITAGGVLADLALHGLHGSGSWVGLGALAGGWLWLARSEVTRSNPNSPNTLEGWKERCEQVLSQFPRLDPDPQPQAQRLDVLQELLLNQQRTTLRLGLVSSGPLSASDLPSFQTGLRGSRPLQLLVSEPLPRKSACWQWDDTFASCDALLFHLKPPLMAADLRWLEALPRELPLWVLMETGTAPGDDTCLADLRSQWPGASTSRILTWDGRSDDLSAALFPLSQWLDRDGAQIPLQTLRRCLRELHGRWQADLERMRRRQWRQLQQRTQWLVAAGVLVTPAMGLDLLVLSVGNGLMLREMAQLWECPWRLEELQAAAMHLGKAALALGVVEWCNQAFATAFKLHGATWLVGGAVQALSAAYLTRVIGHAMADLMARNVGVSEPDLAAIKAEAPLLIAKAAEAERLDWGAFLQDARRWISQQDPALQGQAQGA